MSSCALGTDLSMGNTKLGLEVGIDSTWIENKDVGGFGDEFVDENKDLRASLQGDHWKK